MNGQMIESGVDDMAIKECLEYGRDYYLSRAEQDIEKYRKGDFSVSITKDGVPYTGDVSYRLKKIDFDFGCNLFMLDQYEDEEQQKTYLKQWKKLFNTAVVPLYWEGTEPMQDTLRYDAGVANDVYRRPPVDRVLAYCEENEIKMKGHPLFWHEFIPAWLPESWDNLLPLIDKRFEEIASRYADKIPVFDCVNEPSRIWDMGYEHATDGYKMVAPPEGYVEEVFAIGEKYFPGNTLILNEATGVAFNEFHGDYGAYYLLLKELLEKKVKIDYIGLQCHVNDSPEFKNVFDATRLYGVLDGYAKLGKPLVVSEIGISCDNEKLQAEATEQLYKICFSHPAMSGIFWWNLDDTGILTVKNRDAGAENLPTAGLCHQGAEKAAYKVLDRLINQEWTTKGDMFITDGLCDFRGFYGVYEVLVDKKVYTVSLNKNDNNHVTIEV